MKYRELYHHLVWYYHNDHETWAQWAKNTADMWEDRPMSGTERAKRSQWLEKEGKYAPKSVVFAAICSYLEQICFSKLMFLLKKTE